MSDLISRQAAVDMLMERASNLRGTVGDLGGACSGAAKLIAQLPSAEPEQRYTEEELRVFQHGISLSLLSKRSAQHWHYDKDTATEIEFLERLYEKVGADIRGERDEE